MSRLPRAQEYLKTGFNAEAASAAKFRAAAAKAERDGRPKLAKAWLELAAEKDELARIQLEAAAEKAGANFSRINAFKVLAVKAAAKVANGRPGYGMLLDEKYGREAMFEFARHSFAWLGRPVELPGSRPLR